MKEEDVDNVNSIVVNKSDRHEISIILSLKKITSVNEAYKAKIAYVHGKPVAQIYKSAATKNAAKNLTDQLSKIDFQKEAPWIWNGTKALDITTQVTLNHSFWARDTDNFLKNIQDAFSRAIGINDSRFVSLHAWKTYMPGSPEELICIKVSESKFDYLIQGNTTEIKEKKWKIFLGGTVAGEDWRKSLTKQLKEYNIKVFNPVISDWNPDAIRVEEEEKNKKCNFLLYVITSDMRGPYSIAEAVDSAYKSKEGTDKKVLLYIDKTGFTEDQLHSFQATVDLMQRIGSVNIKAGIWEGKDQLVEVIKEMTGK